MIGVSLNSVCQNKIISINEKHAENNDIIFSPNDKYVIASEKNFVNLYMTGGDKLFVRLETDLAIINDLCIDKEGKLLYVSGKPKPFQKDSPIEVWDIDLKKRIKYFGGNVKEVRAIDLSQDGSKLASVALDGGLRIWNTEKGDILFEKEYKGALLSVDYSSNGQYVAIGGASRQVSVLRTSDYGLKCSLRHQNWVRDVLFSPDSKTIASAGDDGKIYFTNLSDNNTSIIGIENSRVYCLAFSKDGKYLAAGTNDRDIVIWNVANKAEYSRLEKAGKGTFVALDFDYKGNQLATSNNLESELSIWDVRSLNIDPFYKFRDEKDKSPPQIFVSKPANIIDNHVRYSKDIIPISGVILDDSGVRNLRINGKETPLKEDGKFVIYLPLSQGENYVTIEASDVNDNIALKKFTILRKDLLGEEYKPEEATNYLFIIGINDYQYWPKLYNAVSDVNSLVGVLMSRYNFKFENITVIKNEQATRSNIYKGLRSLIEKIKPTDNLVLYYSGHGYFDELLSEGYWVPVDARKGNTGDYLSNSDILKIVKNINSQHTFLIADACFSGSLFGDTKRGYAENVEKYRSRWGLASGRLEVVSDGTEGTNSPFASMLIKYLNNNNKPELTVSEIVQYVKIKVAEITDQTPVGNPLKGAGDEGGEFVFHLK